MSENSNMIDSNIKQDPLHSKEHLGEEVKKKKSKAQNLSPLALALQTLSKCDKTLPLSVNK